MPCCAVVGYVRRHIVPYAQALQGHRYADRVFWVCRLLSQGHVAFIETVRFRTIAFFTILQFIGLAGVYVVASWTGVSTASQSLNQMLKCSINSSC